MGTLPPNVAPDDPSKFPAARFIQLRRLNAFPANPFFGGLNAYGPFPVATTTPPFQPVFNYWDEVVYDYEGSVARKGGISGSGPYLKGAPSTGIIYVTAPYNRPLPYIAQFSAILGSSSAVVASAIAILRHNPSSTSTDYKVLCNSVWVSNGGNTGTYQTRHGQGMDVVPPGQTYAVHFSGTTGSGSGPGAGVYCAYSGSSSTDFISVGGNTFSVLTF